MSRSIAGKIFFLTLTPLDLINEVKPNMVTYSQYSKNIDQIFKGKTLFDLQFTINNPKKLVEKNESAEIVKNNNRNQLNTL